ncbi:hypothetical protein AB3S75_003642 [Citrus x aurantiifolia]
MEEMNQALLMKLSWEIVSNSDKLWVKVFCSKYGLESSNLPMALPDKPGSQIWRAVCSTSTWLATVQGARWFVCDGGRARFWIDCWATKYPLINLALHPIPQELINATVSEYTNVKYKCATQEGG